MTLINDLAANFATCSRLVEEAAPAGAKLLCFPESFSFVGAKDGDSVKIAELLDGPIMQQYSSLARFDADVPGGRVYKESKFTEAVDSPIGRLGLIVCYDLRIPETTCYVSNMEHSIHRSDWPSTLGDSSSRTRY